MTESANAGAMSQQEIVALLRELRDEFTDREDWSVKRATWSMAILAAEGKLNKGRKPQHPVGETTHHD